MTQPGDDLGPFTDVRLLHHGPVADLLGGADGAGRPVVVLALTQAAGADPGWRAAFVDLVGRDRAGVSPIDPQNAVSHAGELQGARPWVASRYEPPKHGVERLLAMMPGALPPGVDPFGLVASLGTATMAPPPPIQSPPPIQMPGTSHYSSPLDDPFSSGARTPTSGPFSANPQDPYQADYASGPQDLQQYPTPLSVPPVQRSGPPLSTLGAPSYGTPEQATPFSAPPTTGGTPIPPFPPPTTAAPTGSGNDGRRAGITIAVITLVTLLVMAGAGFIALVYTNSGGDNKDTQAASTPSTAPAATDSPLPVNTGGASPTPSRSPLPATTPTLRTGVQDVSIVGPNWKDGDKTQLIDLNGWPMAFRLPEGWSCLRGTIAKIPDADAWGCVKTDGANHSQRLNLMLRRCPNGCNDSDKSTMNKAWFDDKDEPNVKKFDANTYYVVIPKTDKGFYAIDSSSYCADKPGGKLTYEVAVYFESPDQYKDEMQKSLNDIRSQLPQPA